MGLEVSDFAPLFRIQETNVPNQASHSESRKQGLGFGFRVNPSRSSTDPMIATPASIPCRGSTFESLGSSEPSWVFPK